MGKEARVDAVRKLLGDLRRRVAAGINGDLDATIAELDRHLDALEELERRELAEAEELRHLRHEMHRLSNLLRLELAKITLLP